MKITFLLTQSLQDPSGLGRYWPLAKELSRLGHNVTIFGLHPDFESVRNRHFAYENLQIQYVAPMHVWKRKDTKGYYPAWSLPGLILQATWALTRAAFSTESDLIHIAKAHPMNGLAGLIASRWLQKPLYVDCDDWEVVSNRMQNVIQKKVLAWWENRLPHYSEKATVNTRFLEQRLIKLGIPPQKIVYIPNGVDRERFNQVNTDRVRALREQLELTNHPVIGYIGSMSLASHPVDLLIEAFDIVTRTVKKAVLLLVGGGESLSHLRNQVIRLGLEQSVRFVGRVPADEVPSYLTLADVTVDPVNNDDIARSRSPLKVFESLAVGTPVVTGNVGDRSEILARGKAGILVRPGSCQALAEGIIVALQDTDRLAAMRTASLSLRENYYWDILIHQFVHTYYD